MSPARLSPRFRFSLRALLIAMALVAAALGWIHAGRAQTQLVENVLAANPSTVLLYDFEVTEDGKLQETPAPPGPAWLRERLGLDYLSSVVGAELYYATDADLQAVTRLPKLRRLYLERCIDLTDAGLEQLATLEHLKLLVLDDADQVTDEGLQSLGRLKGLAHLQLDLGGQMTPTGIDRLRRELPDCHIEIIDQHAAPPLAWKSGRSSARY